MASASRLGVVSVVLSVALIGMSAPVLGQSAETEPVDHDGNITVVTDTMPETLYEDEGAKASVLVKNEDTRTLDVVVVLYVEGTPIAMRPSTMDPGTSETFTFPAGPSALVENSSYAPGTADISPGGNYTWSVRIGTVEWGTLETETVLQGVSNDTYQGVVALNDARVTREFQFVGEDRTTPIAAATTAETADTDSGGETSSGDDSDGTGSSMENSRESSAGGSEGDEGRTRGFFSNDTEGSISSFTLTVGGFVLSVVGILYEMISGG